MQLTRVLLPATIVLALAMMTARAEAYPIFQLSTGTETCHECHDSPAGGGLLNDYGRDEASDISMWQKGDGRFLHGLWSPPDSFQIGGDFREVFFGDEDKPDTGNEVFFFPMQAELYLRPKVGNVTASLSVGLRESRAVIAPATREDYVMYESPSNGWYVRAGRFFPVYGLRLQDHTTVVRRDLNMYLYEEPYGVAYGKYMASSEYHVSAFAKAFGPLAYLGSARDSGVAGYYEKRDAAGTTAFGAQAKVTVSDEDRRAWIGGIYKKWLDGPKVLLMGEVDADVQMFPKSGGISPSPLLGTVAYASASYTVKQGFVVTPALEHFDADSLHHGSSRDAVDLNLQWFPIPHVEVHILGRVQTEALDTSRPTYLVLSQLHYML